VIAAAEGSPSQVLYGRSSTGATFSLVRSADLGKTWIPLYVTEAGLQQPGFVARLRAVGVHVDATTRPGRHDWRLWRSMLPTTLLWLGARFGAP